MTDFGKRHEKSAVSDRRRTSRTPVSAGAIVMTTASRLSAVLVDISEGGAQLTGCLPPQRGRDVQIRIAGHTLFGGIAWRKDETFGVKFEEALGHHELAMIDTAIMQAKCEERATGCEVTLLPKSNRAAPRP